MKPTLPCLSLALLATSCLLADTYRSIPLKSLLEKDAVIDVNHSMGAWNVSAQPFQVQVKGEGEGCHAVIESERDYWNETPDADRIVMRIPDSGRIEGFVLIPIVRGWNSDTKRGQDVALSPTWRKVAFNLTPTDGAPATELDFHKAKVGYYGELLESEFPGAPLFRHLRDEHQAIVERLDPKQQGKMQAPPRFRRTFNEAAEERIMDVFTGNKAVQENLQLDRPLQPAGNAVEPRTKPFDSLPGIDVKAFDWKPLLVDAKPDIDPAAGSIPEDQHAVFFRTFKGMIAMMDEADARGTPLATHAFDIGEDSRTRERYQKQLCLDVTELARVAGPFLVKSIAATGSDLFLPTGSDIGIIFETSQPEILKAFFTAKQALAKSSDATVKVVQETIAETPVMGVENPDRTVRSFVAVRGGFVYVSNSRLQLQRMLETAQGKRPSLAATDEFRFFRTRYARDTKSETAFIFLGDATLRRWCGPRWRILALRRSEAMAALLKGEAARIKDPSLPRPVSDEFGSIAFMTPLLEVASQEATEAEATTYERWRKNYQLHWRRVFDPIALRLELDKDHYGADLTVMPLIAGSDYRDEMEWMLKGAIPAQGANRHPGTLLHLAVGIDPESRMIRQFGSMIGLDHGDRDEESGPTGIIKALKPKPLAWVGRSLSVCLDSNQLTTDLTKASIDTAELSRTLENRIDELPLSIWIENRDTVGLGLFLTTLRGMAQSAAPGMMTWETRRHQGREYVAIEPAGKESQDRDAGFDKLKIYYAPTPDALYITLQESLMQAYLDRSAKTSGTAANAPATPPAAPATTPAPSDEWLGSHIALECSASMLDLFEISSRNSRERTSSNASWRMIPVLNTLRQLAPDKDAPALYENLWMARPACPAGGTYVWNAEDGTYESTVTGNPLHPRKFTPQPILPQIETISTGITFENDGLRARVNLKRTVKEKP